MSVFGGCPCLCLPGDDMAAVSPAGLRGAAAV